ncbi:hypothetical protein [Glutamicibacter sp.]|uniref:hypothetical protein n=1 Tax=Glutamicibacter sp. TaxID=1931995 RepID=UPI0028BE078A|nr:hypothetical protein [Glutamicibacter sp.]
MSSVGIALAARWALPMMALISSAAHIWLAAESSGAMAVVMLISGLLCLGCAGHAIFSRHQVKSQSMTLLLMSAAGALLHMGLITAHYAAGRHSHGAEPQAASASGHMLQMLGLVGYELLLVFLAAVVVRVLSARPAQAPEAPAALRPVFAEMEISLKPAAFVAGRI